MSDALPTDAASYARAHAGELEPDLTPNQRAVLGRVIAQHLARGTKLELIARAVARVLPELESGYAQRLGRDETLRAVAWETLQAMRAQGAGQVTLSPAVDACPTCRAAGGTYALDAVPIIPVAGCTHAGGCRCLYRSPDEAAPSASAAAAPGSTLGTMDADAPRAELSRPWYRPRPPRPHGPRWTEEQKAARRQRGPKPPAKPPKPPRQPSA